MKLFKPGDLVAFSSKWLTSTQAHELGRDRGEVQSVASSDGLVLVAVKWADGGKLEPCTITWWPWTACTWRPYEANLLRGSRPN